TWSGAATSCRTIRKGLRRWLRATCKASRSAPDPSASWPGQARPWQFDSVRAGIGLQRLLVDLAVAADKPVLVRERLAGDTVGEPIGHEYRRERPEVRGRHIADRVARLLIHHHPLGALHGLDQPHRVLDRRQLVELAGDAQIRH